MYWLNGSRLSRSVPANRTGSCSISVICDLRVFNPSSEIFTPSICISPLNNSTIRNNHWVIELLPLPVRPTMPTFSHGSTSKLIDYNTIGVLSLYRIDTSLKIICPLLGQLVSVASVWRIRGASPSKCIRYSRRSTAIIWFSRSAWLRTIQNTKSGIMKLNAVASAAYPGET